MLKRVLLLAALAAILFVPRGAEAVIGTIDVVPAATLLLPYFEVDLNNAQGATTLFSINNASATAVLAHVTFWSDLSVPTFAFNVYLTGYDVQTINIRDIFNGTAPRTASVGQDPTDTISNQGNFSQDINFASCNGQLPPPPIPANYVAHLQAQHSGNPSALFGGLCSGVRYNDNIMRGYITVDTVNNCTLDVANTPGYFVNGGAGSATNQNVLWGDYFHVNPEQNFAQGDALVHIEAAPGVGLATSGTYGVNPETGTPGQYTFYGRSVAWQATDNREPLATNFGVRYITGGAFNGGTNLIAWRDSKINQGTFICPATPGVRPSWYPLLQQGIVIFDEAENPFVIPPPPFYPPQPDVDIVPFTTESIRVQVDGSTFPIPFNFGWMYLNLNHSQGGGVNPAEDPAAAQAWVVATHSAEGRYSVGYQANQLDSATNTANSHNCPASGGIGACP
jgi:hypothetical protein